MNEHTNIMPNIDYLYLPNLNFTFGENLKRKTWRSV